jgi:hypothetical protein
MEKAQAAFEEARNKQGDSRRDRKHLSEAQRQVDAEDERWKKLRKRPREGLRKAAR